MEIFLSILLLLLLGWHLHFRRRQLEARHSVERQLEQIRQERDRVLLQARQQLETMFHSMVEGVLVLDRTGRAVMVNRSLEKMFGIQGDWRGKTVLEVLRHHEISELAGRVRAEGQIVEHPLEISGIKSRLVHINAARLLGSDGDYQGAILVFHDLTRLNELENTRKEFVANVSHELRTPLSLIKGFVETLLDGAKDDPETATRFLQTIEKHANRLAYLIDDLLTISRLESGQIVLNLQPADLREIAGRVLDDLQSRAAERNVSLQNQIPPGSEAVVDGARMQQVFFNLIDNAIKYGRAGGRVIVSAEKNETGDWQVSVSDDGPGIPPEATARVFERFFRVDKARAREQGGTGLGLSIVKHIVQSHGGDVGVKSLVGQGSTFFFTIPARR